MEGVRLFNIKELIAASGEAVDASDPQKSREIYTVSFLCNPIFRLQTILTYRSRILDDQRLVAEDLKVILSGLARHLFGETEQKMIEDYFPFTSPSFELEVHYCVCACVCNAHSIGLKGVACMCRSSTRVAGSRCWAAE